jgi:hypothetical protein
LAAIPYAIVGVIATCFVLAELVKLFGGHISIALKSSWTYVLVGVNVIAALIAYVAARYFLNVESDYWLALFVGVSYPLLLRSRFTLFRSVGSKEVQEQLSALTLRMDDIYGGMQERCYRQIDNAVAASRSLEAQALAATYQQVDIVAAIRRVIDARQVAADQEKDRAYLKAILEEQDSEDRRTYMLALFLRSIADGKERSLLPSVPSVSVEPPVTQPPLAESPLVQPSSLQPPSGA